MRAIPGDAAILQSILAAFPDRVARHRRDGELLLSAGGSARFPNCRWEFLVAVDIEERREHGVPLVRLAAPIEPEWLLDRAAERISLEWNRTAERVEQVTALVYDQLVIEETRAPAPPSEEASRLLAQKALEAGVGRFADRDAVEQVRSRAAFGGITIDVEAALAAQCQGRTSFARARSRESPGRDSPAASQPRGSRPAAASRRPRGPGALRIRQAALDRIAPAGFLRNARDAADRRRIPWWCIFSAPNRRPVQVTSDLAGFWERLYPQVRKELARRYPKHKWPEKPV